MSENEPPEVPATALGPIRPLSIRITDGLRAQLDVVAQLNGRSVTEEIRLALEAWVETSKSDPPEGAPACRDGPCRNRARSPDQAERHRGHLRNERRSSQAGLRLTQDWDPANWGGCPGDQEPRGFSPGGRRPSLPCWCALRYVREPNRFPAACTKEDRHGRRNRHPGGGGGAAGGARLRRGGDYQSAVGGWIEAVYIPSIGVSVYVNEEGLLQQRPFNARPTFLWWVHVPEVRQRATLVCDAVVVGLPDRTGDPTDVPELLASRMVEFSSQNGVATGHGDLREDALLALAVLFANALAEANNRDR